MLRNTPTMPSMASAGKASNSSSTRTSGFDPGSALKTVSNSSAERIGPASTPNAVAISDAMRPITTPASRTVFRRSTLVATTSIPRCRASLRSRRTASPTIHDLPRCRGAQTVM